MDDVERRMMLERRRAHELRNHKRLESNYSEEDLKKICEYLENPTRTGVWILKASKEGRLGEYIKKEIEEIVKNKETIEINSGKRKIRISLKNKDKESLFGDFNRFTFVFNLFTYLYHFEKDDDSFENYLEMEDSSNKFLFNLIDLGKLKKEYEEAFEFFKKEIYFEDFDTTVRDGKITKIKEGFFLFSKKEDPYHSPNYVPSRYSGQNVEEKVELLALSKKTLEKIQTFFEKAGFIGKASITPVFSPEEEVFSPYFSFLDQVHPKIIDNKNIQRLFRKSISEYSDDNYPHCISTIGLITEEYLVQIYETLFRDICPKRPLGELYDQIHLNLKKDIVKPEEKVIEFVKFYDKIKKLEDKGDNSLGEVIPLLRDFVNLAKEVHFASQTKIQEMQKPKTPISIFSRQLRDNISELIKNRNAISHRSRIPIGNYEALRSVYCCITLILWWTKQKSLIDWSKDPKEIIKMIINQNSM